MNILHAVVLGIIEGFTEFLPISSTAHLLFAERFLKLPSTAFLESFSIVIQFGAILAVVVLFFKRFIRDWESNKRIIVAFIPTAIIGLLLYKVLKDYLLVHVNIAMWVLGIGGIIIILFERIHKDEHSTIVDIDKIPYWKAFVIGCCQAIAIVPGVSRSGATIIPAMLLGIKRNEAVEFSFLLAVPTMAAASGYDFLKSYHALSGVGGGLSLIAIGFIVSFIFALIGVKFFIGLIKHASLEGFGWYRVFASTLLFILQSKI